MIRVLTDLNNVSRFETAAHADVILKGSQGMWVTVNSSDTAIYPTASGEALAFAVFNESDYSVQHVGPRATPAAGTTVFSPDVAETNKVSLLYGKYRAITDQYYSDNVDGIATGTKLTVNTNGLLDGIAPATAGDFTASGFTIHAVCVKAHTNLVHRGQTYANALEYITV